MSFKDYNAEESLLNVGHPDYHQKRSDFLMDESGPINPAARRAPAGGPPEATMLSIPEPGNEADKVIPCPRVVTKILTTVQEQFPQVIFRKIYGINDKNVISFQVDKQLIFFSWYEGIPELDDVESSSH